MNLLKELNPNEYEKCEKIIEESFEKFKELDEKSKKELDKFIEGFLTESEFEKFQEYTFQITDMIEKINSDKILMQNDISISHLYSSALQLFCRERAKLYMNAVNRINKTYKNDLYEHICEFKNL